eukprot:m.51238 g.51238  ORF g.51238 m.51238 type:complete len:67 (-) comp12607_c0_seq1:868-1068(-)
MIYNFYLFNREGLCLYFKEWKRTGRSQTREQAEGNRQLLYGLLYSLKKFAGHISPTDKSVVAFLAP